MKKLLYLLLAITVIGCSINEDTTDPSSTENLLPKRITCVGESTTIYDFYYDQNKIVKIKSESTTLINGTLYKSVYTTDFTYTNNLITRVSDYNDDSPTEADVKNFSYDTNGRIKKVTGQREGEFNATVLYDFIDTIEYAANGDFTVKSEDQNGNPTSQICKVKNGNVVIIETLDSYGPSKTSLSFDDKNSPWKNITGAYNLSVYNIYLFTRSDQIVAFKNNVTEAEFTPDNVELSIFAYDYNEFDYPRNISETYYGVPGAFITTIEYY